MTDRLGQIIDELEVLHARKIALLRKLRRAIALKNFIPDVFDHGVVKCHASGDARNMVYRVQFSNVHQEDRVFDLLEVPFFLWPEGIKDDIRSSRKFWGSKYRARLRKEEKNGK